MNKHITPYFTAVILIILVIEAVFVFNYQKGTRENDNWTGPYFSAAANLKFGDGFLIDVQEVQKFQDLSPEGQQRYQFQRSSELSHYNHNPVGFAYIIWAATHLFPFMGNQEALVILQVLIHFLLALLMLYVFRQHKVFMVIFLIGYVLNPFVINFVVLDYYYFWQCIPVFLTIYLLKAEKIKWLVLISFMVLTLFSVLARPTTIFITGLAIFVLFTRIRYLHAALLILPLIILAFIISKPIEKNIWHTVYVGVAAYPNPYVNELSDNTGYALYKEKTGVELNASVGGNYYEDSVINAYQEITRNEVLTIAKERPGIFFLNAALNFFQCYFIGYLTSADHVINIICAVIGLIVILLGIKTKQYLILFSIMLYTGSFCLYFPPIQSYLFGCYFLTMLLSYNILFSLFRLNVSPISFSLKRQMLPD